MKQRMNQRMNNQQKKIPRPCKIGFNSVYRYYFLKDWYLNLFVKSN